MEATYCVGNDIDVCRMFDQYLYKRTENVDLSLSIPQSNFHSNGYEMNDQTFHTPSFGDEEFDIPAIHPQQQPHHPQQPPHHPQQPHHPHPHSQPPQHTSPPQQQQQQPQQTPPPQQHTSPSQHNDPSSHYQPPMQGMQQMNQQINQQMNQQQQQQESMGMHDPTGGYQQPIYLPGPPDHGMINPGAYHNSPHPNSYPPPPPPQALSQQQQHQQQHNNQLLMIQQQQQQQQQHHQMMMSHGQPQPPPPPSGHMGPYHGTSPQHPQGRGNSSSPVVPGQEHTTSEDSDDSTPHPAIINSMKRPSPEPADQAALAKTQKKPKVQKKKKKRDPNEPQKPVSAYALFFRDTQAAIKGQNPNASFGEVSKIVASMWDALDSEHKNVYKKKTEAAKKEYLKALAAYRASLVSKGAGENGEAIYGNYPPYNPGGPPAAPPHTQPQPPPQYGGYNPPPPQPRTIPSPPSMAPSSSPPSQQQQPSQQQAGKKSPLMNPGGPGQSPHHPGMMPSPMGPGHMSMQMPPHMQPPPQHNSYMQQVPQHMPVSPQQHMPVSPQQGQHVPMSPHMQQHMSPPPMVSSSPPAQSPVAAAQQHQQMRSPNSCIRHGCPNPAITNPEWEDEYCSNECVVSHCRDVFTNWVAGNKNQTQNYSTVK